PIVLADNLIGVLDVQSDLFNRFHDSDVRIMTTFAAQIAVAVQNARTFGEMEAARQRAEAVANINAALTKAQTELDILTPIFELLPKENVGRAGLLFVETDSSNHPVAVTIAAGFTPDGRPLDLSVYPTTRLTLDQYPFFQMVTTRSSEATV